MDNQYTLWHRMIELIARYRQGHIGFATLVTDLEGIMDAQRNGDKQTIKLWYDLWTPLESRNAIHGDNVHPGEVSAELNSLEGFVKAQM